MGLSINPIHASAYYRRMHGRAPHMLPVWRWNSPSQNSRPHESDKSDRCLQSLDCDDVDQTTCQMTCSFFYLDAQRSAVRTCDHFGDAMSFFPTGTIDRTSLLSCISKNFTLQKHAHLVRFSSKKRMVEVSVRLSNARSSRFFAVRLMDARWVEAGRPALRSS